jgi:hypothetical protein
MSAKDNYQEDGVHAPPQFSPNIPKHLLADMDEQERWLYERASIQEQQNEWLMRRAIMADVRHAKADSRMSTIEARIKPFEELKVVLTAKWSVLAILFSGLVAPLLLAAFGAWIASFLNK